VRQIVVFGVLQPVWCRGNYKCYYPCYSVVLYAICHRCQWTTAY